MGRILVASPIYIIMITLCVPDSLGVALDSASEDEADIPELPVPQHNIIG